MFQTISNIGYKYIYYVYILGVGVVLKLWLVKIIKQIIEKKCKKAV